MPPPESYAGVHKSSPEFGPSVGLDTQNADLDDPVGKDVNAGRLQVDHRQRADKSQVAEHEVDLRVMKG